MLELVIRIVVLSTEEDSWVSCCLDEIRVTWLNEEEIRFVRFLGGDSRGWGIGDVRNNGGAVENGFVSMRLMHQGSCEMWKIEALSERKFYRIFEI